MFFDTWMFYRSRMRSERNGRSVILLIAISLIFPLKQRFYHPEMRQEYVDRPQQLLTKMEQKLYLGIDG